MLVAGALRTVLAHGRKSGNMKAGGVFWRDIQARTVPVALT